ncbi:hypothetical protein ACFVXE_06920, partial [Streptomyces sp. NPDC058231]|uniref:hypothetical protein n=1 Tax=Streptomyces sp. NPDC058231 TaxID=3346392 RepID=UPI0036E7CA11
THPLGLSSGLSLRSCVSDSIRLFRVRFPVEAGSAFQLLAFAIPFPASSNLPDSFSFRFRFDFDSDDHWSGLAFRLIRLYQKHFHRNDRLRGPVKGIDRSGEI